MELRSCTGISYTMSFSLFCFPCCLPLAKGPLLAYGPKSASEARLGAPHTPAPTKSDWPCRQASFISRGGTSQATSAPARGPQGCCLCTTMALLDLLSSQIMLSCPHFSVVVQEGETPGNPAGLVEGKQEGVEPRDQPLLRIVFLLYVESLRSSKGSIWFGLKASSPCFHS